MEATLTTAFSALALPATSAANTRSSGLPVPSKWSGNFIAARASSSALARSARAFASPLAQAKASLRARIAQADRDEDLLAGAGAAHRVRLTTSGDACVFPFKYKGKRF